MKFKINNKYIAMQILYTGIGCMIGFIFLYFTVGLPSVDGLWGIGIAIFALCFIMKLRLKIKIEDDYLLFNTTKLWGNKTILLSNIKSMEIVDGKFLNYVIITTKEMKRYKIYPSDCNHLIEVINSNI